jgi:hypothetical protein
MLFPLNVQYDPGTFLCFSRRVAWPGSTGTMKIESSLFLTFFTAESEMGFLNRFHVPVIPVKIEDLGGDTALRFDTDFLKKSTFLSKG